MSFKVGDIVWDKKAKDVGKIVKITEYGAHEVKLMSHPELIIICTPDALAPMPTPDRFPWNEELEHARRAVYELLQNEYEYWTEQAVAEAEGRTPRLTRDEGGYKAPNPYATAYLNAIRLLKAVAGDKWSEP